MKIYTNSQINISIEDRDDVEELVETYIYTQKGIYKKYKKHFFLCNCEKIFPKTEKIVHDGNEYFVEENSLQINKQKILTSIPYNCYFVNRFTIKCSLDNDIIFVKELDNEHFESYYFILNNIEQIKYIGSYIK
tara:strand:+ start:224 stop:625 length:402 start_codon:yes stop_codon:yes gene_type:complete